MSAIAAPLYRVTMPDNSMAPAIRKGDQLDVDPTMPVIPGRRYVFTQTGKEDRPFIAELVSATDAEWTVRQFSHGKPARLSRQEWPAAHRVFRVMYAD